MADVAINFAPTPATWDQMTRTIAPLGRIIAAAMVPDPVPLNQEWLTGTGVTITGTSTGTRAQMAALMAAEARAPFRADITPIALDQATAALTALHQGRARGRQVIVF
jgi:alcohol dehydrogenase, propanol-preferring